ncbi:cytochrome P450 89A2-like [Hordeum vulgare subsp. vulgare]|uniref:cytochrome P450 89A2-like n=1 Tax=Hordeum vulgare subsp. vulgare TaxID=112509 RepID=UPI000295B672|nr:cytochrome P450 89A2-like [Hordeum vulgare subsp. vulgare]
MEVLLAVLLLLSVAILLQQSTRRSRAQTALHKVVDTAAAHRALNEKASAFSNRPVAIFPVVLATGLHGERNENITTVKYGAHWRALRCNLMAKSLHPSRLASLAPMQREASRALVADLSSLLLAGEGEVVVARNRINAAVFGLVARLCFGDGVDARDVRAMELVIQDFIISMGELNPVFDGTMLCKVMNWRRLGRLFAFLARQTKLFLPLINARRRPESRACTAGGGVEPYVDSLLDLRVPEPDDDASGKQGNDARRELRDDELVSLVSEFLGAGSGSVVASLEWTLAHLVEQPDVQEKLRQEIIDCQKSNIGGVISSKTLRGMPYLHAVVMESLRMHPPVPFILRGVHGEGAAAVGATMTAVPADGLRVQFVVGDIGRDGKTWTDPDEFRPERFLAGGEAEGIGPTPGPKEIRMMPFGAAHRHCPGSSQAMLHIKFFLAALVHEFEWASPAEDCSVDLTELDGFFKVMKKPLSARVTQRTQDM